MDKRARGKIVTKLILNYAKSGKAAPVGITGEEVKGVQTQILHNIHFEAMDHSG